MIENTHDTLTGTTMLTLAGQFPNTRWTLVLAAGNEDQPGYRAAALSSLCESYWYPLYAYLRRRGYDSDQAGDLTQEFILRLLSGRYMITRTRKKAASVPSCCRRSSSFFPMNGTASTRKNAAAGRQRFRSKSPRERNSIGVSRRTTKRPNASMKDAGLAPCWTTCRTGCATSSYAMEGWIISIASGDTWWGARKFPMRNWPAIWILRKARSKWGFTVSASVIAICCAPKLRPPSTTSRR